MYQFATLLLLLLGLCSCLGSEAEPQSSPRQLSPAAPPDSMTLPVQADRSFVPGTRFGAIRPDMSILDIERVYGAEQLVTTEVALGEGMTAPGYRLFPDQRDEALLLLGEDKRPATVTVRSPEARWYSPKPAFLMVRMRLAELVASNGCPFTFSGFNWDYGGTVTDWRGGRLTGTRVRLSYAPESLTTEGLPDRLQGDQPIPSDAEELQPLDIYVAEFTVGLRPNP